MGEGPILVVGASGLVGRACVAALAGGAEVVGTYHRRPRPGLVRLDMTAAGEAERLVGQVAPRVVICAGADPHVEGCEIDPAGTRLVNVEGTVRLAEAARRADAAFVFFSSEYVFDGAAGPYAEDAPRWPLNEYGRQKVECETALAAIPRSLVVRTSGVFGWNEDSKNFVLQLIARLGRGERMRVPTDQDITPSYAPNLASVLTELVDAGVTGVLHVAGACPINRAEFARIGARVFGLDPGLVDAVPTAALGLKAPRPHAAGLSTRKAASLARTPLLDPEEGLITMRDAARPE
jgi:dTDP-4-dehydrorhamnose reductase